jgi:hypothetical protein
MSIIEMETTFVLFCAEILFVSIVPSSHCHQFVPFNRAMSKSIQVDSSDEGDDDVVWVSGGRDVSNFTIQHPHAKATACAGACATVDVSKAVTVGESMATTGGVRRLCTRARANRMKASRDVGNCAANALIMSLNRDKIPIALKMAAIKRTFARSKRMLLHLQAFKQTA